jgi:hypothetical protein
MHTKYAKPENLAKLTPEQKKVYDAWVTEDEKANVIFQKMLDAISVNDGEMLRQLTIELAELIPAQCEHGRSIHKSCGACLEIEKILFPEDFDAEGNRLDEEQTVFTAPGSTDKKWLN